MSKKQLWQGGILIVAGIHLFLGSRFGYGVTWPVWPIGIGLLTLVAPWADDPVR